MHAQCYNATGDLTDAGAWDFAVFTSHIMHTKLPVCIGTVYL